MTKYKCSGIFKGGVVQFDCRKESVYLVCIPYNPAIGVCRRCSKYYKRFQRFHNIKIRKLKS